LARLLGSLVFGGGSVKLWRPTMPGVCPECRAPVPEGGSCRDNFHALLVLEAEIPGGPGDVPHFYAVGSYALQHPESMGYTAQALASLRACLADHLDGRATLDAVRRRVRRGAEGAKRVTRRAGDEVVRWRVESWPMTVADECAGGIEGYGERVEQWARSIRDTLDGLDAEQSAAANGGRDPAF
jgi:hypothetical protein